MAKETMAFATALMKQSDASDAQEFLASCNGLLGQALMTQHRFKEAQEAFEERKVLLEALSEKLASDTGKWSQGCSLKRTWQQARLIWPNGSL